MQHHVATEHLNQLVPSMLEVPVLERFDYTQPEEVLPRDDVISFDQYAERYFDATGRLYMTMEKHRDLIAQKPVMHSLLNKLLDMFQEAASGSFEGLKNVINAGEATMEGVLDMLEDIGVNAEASGIENEYAELEAELTALHQQYF